MGWNWISKIISNILNKDIQLLLKKISNYKQLKKIAYDIFKYRYKS